MKKPVFKLPKELGNELPQAFLSHLLDGLSKMEEYSDFDGEASYTFFVGDDEGIYFTPELKGKKKKSLYTGLNEMFGTICDEAMKQI